MKDFFKFVILGLCVGLINGLVGSAGGLISVLALNKFFNLEQKRAQATTLSYIWLLSIATIIIYLFKVKPKFEIILPLVISGSAGAFCGIYFLRKLNNNIIKKIFGAILIITSGIMFFR